MNPSDLHPHELMQRVADRSYVGEIAEAGFGEGAACMRQIAHMSGNLEV